MRSRKHFTCIYWDTKAAVKGKVYEPNKCKNIFVTSSYCVFSPNMSNIKADNNALTKSDKARKSLSDMKGILSSFLSLKWKKKHISNYIIFLIITSDYLLLKLSVQSHSICTESTWPCLEEPMIVLKEHNGRLASRVKELRWANETSAKASNVDHRLRLNSMMGKLNRQLFCCSASEKWVWMPLIPDHV